MSLYALSKVFGLVVVTMLPTIADAGASEDERLPLFDAHMHYNAPAAEQFSPQAVIAKLDKAGVSCALISSTPNDHTLALKELAPERVIAFARPYRRPRDKRDWFTRTELLEELKLWGSDRAFAGIGEFHLYSPQLNPEVIRALVGVARKHNIPLQAHGDKGMIDALLEYSEGITIIWAHAGTDPYPPTLETMLERHPRLFVDLSLRDRLIAPGGQLSRDWRDLFEAYPNRFLAAIDTYSINQWEKYEALVAKTRHWLNQLSAETARAIAYGNATRLFGCNAHSQS